MKHADEIITGHNFFNSLFAEGTAAGDGGWPEEEIATALGVNLIDDAADADGEVQKMIDREAVVGGWWRVSWPDHVVTPRFNADATYAGPFATEAEAHRAGR